MAKTKPELLEDARNLGITDVDEDTTNEVLEDRIREAKAARDAGDEAETPAPAPTDVQQAKADAIAKAAPDRDLEDVGVGGRDSNAALEHTRGGATTRDDALDAGVPMLAGDPTEPVGPEDAFGEGEKRGDYSGRTQAGPHLESVPIPGGSQPIRNEDGQIVDYTPNAVLVGQEAATLEHGDEPGVKGGVGTR